MGAKELFRAIDDFPNSGVYTNGITYMRERRPQKRCRDACINREIDNMVREKLVHT